MCREQLCAALESGPWECGQVGIRAEELKGWRPQPCMHNRECIK